MRSTLLIGCLLWAAVSVYSLTRVERPASIHKRAASPQVFQRPPNSTHSGNNNWNQTQQFQWVKVNNQWVRRDGTTLPGYSSANTPYNQTGNQWNAPIPTPSRSPSLTQTSGVNSWNTAQRPGNQSASSGQWNQQPTQQRPQQAPQSSAQQYPRRQNSTSQGGLGWNPDADRALTQDLPQTTPRPVQVITQPPVVPQTPQSPQRPAPGTPPVSGPFGSGRSAYERPTGGQTSWNPDASLTYGTGGRNIPSDRTKTPINPNAGRGGSNPWGGLFN